jgi:hypothetical protein
LKSSLWTCLVFLALVVPVHATVKSVAMLDRSKGSRSSMKKPVFTSPTLAVANTVPLSPQQLSISLKVLTGYIPCELGAGVALIKDERSEGRFLLSLGRHSYAMEPVVTSTGAVRLEDAASGAVWIQVSNKSMLMNQKLGVRMADACVHPEQLLVAQAMERVPVLGLLDASPATAMK